MKRIYIFTLAALVAAGCAKVVEQDVSEGQQITITASFANEQSKTTLIDGGTDVYWEAGDKVNLFFDGKGSEFTAICTEPARTSKFTGTMNMMFGYDEGSSDTTPLIGLYPYDANATADNSSVTTTLPSEQVGKAGSFASGMNLSVAKSTSFSMGFYNVCGGLRFSVTRSDVKNVVFKSLNGENIAGKVKIGFDGNIPEVQEVVEGVDSIVLTAPAGGCFETGKWYYIVALSGTLSGGFKMTFNTDTQYAVLKSTDSKTIKRGMFGQLADADKNLTYKIYKDKYVDLSANGTANCYMVSQKGCYKFKANVKGNSTTILDGTPVTATVLWESFNTDEQPDNNDIIKSVSFEENDVFFNYTGTSGNAVIAVKDNSGKILWSWHIWATGYDPLNEYDTYIGHEQVLVMNRNLGALSNVHGDVRTFGFYYQWGRKDPFPSSSSMSEFVMMATAPSSVFDEKREGHTVEYAVEHPTTSILENSNYDWLNTSDNHLWASTKTMYDPCPYGWKVPDTSLYDRFNSTSDYSRDKTNRGVLFGSSVSSPEAYFPCNGNNGGGKLNGGEFGISCHYWTNSAQRLCIYSESAPTTSYYCFRSHGFPVRCCRDLSVGPIPVDSISLSSINLKLGESKTISPEIFPKGSTDKTIKWTIGSSTRVTDPNDDRHIIASDNKSFRRILSQENYGKEIYLGFSYYIGGVLQNPPHWDTPEDFEEIESFPLTNVPIVMKGNLIEAVQEGSTVIFAETVNGKKAVCSVIVTQ